MTKMMPLPEGYAEFFKTLKQRIYHARISAGRAVNRELITLYWDLGKAVVEKIQFTNWGDSVVEQIARDLKSEFPNISGFSVQNLWRMRRFYEMHNAPDFLSQVVREMKVSPGDHESLSQVVRELVAEVPWGHHVNLLTRVTDPKERLYYLRATARFGWSRRVLLNQLKADAYGRAVSEQKTHNFDLALTDNMAEQADEMLKSRYNLEFLGINQAVKERELEDRLIAHLQTFILELGYGFCFIGRQYRLALGSKEYFVDLLFYHRFLKTLVAFDLKIGSFEPEHSGKMDFYLNLLNEKERAPDDNPSIGIILCAEKDDIEVEFALKTKNNPIGVAEYQLKSTLPPDLRKKLPTSKQLANAMRDILSKEN